MDALIVVRTQFDSLKDAWITVVFVGDVETGRLLTAYQNRKLEREYGGRPWLNT